AGKLTDENGPADVSPRDSAAEQSAYGPHNLGGGSRGRSPSLADGLSEVELLGDEVVGDRDPDPPDWLRLSIEAGDGISIGLHLNFPPFSIPRHRQGQSMAHAGLHLFQHIVPLPDLPAVYRDNRISLANAGSRRGLVREHFSDDGSPEGLQRMGGLEPLLEGIRMDRENHRLPSIQ